jgi:hypothetical protein
MVPVGVHLWIIVISSPLSCARHRRSARRCAESIEGAAANAPAGQLVVCHQALQIALQRGRRYGQTKGIDNFIGGAAERIADA